MSDEAVAAVHAQTGFDKVMAYRFHDDWSGEVIAEKNVDPAFEDYLGQRFPASDLPQIARDLYLRNPFRSIPNVDAGAVPIVGAAPLDLTFSELRSVSPVHLQYLRNMHVAASCSFADAVATLETDKRMRFIDRIDSAIERIVEDLAAAAEIGAALARNGDELLGLVNASGAALILPNRCVRLGATPPEDAMRNIAEMNAAKGLFVTAVRVVSIGGEAHDRMGR